MTLQIRLKLSSQPRVRSFIRLCVQCDRCCGGFNPAGKQVRCSSDWIKYIAGVQSATSVTGCPIYRIILVFELTWLCPWTGGLRGKGEGGQNRQSPEVDGCAPEDSRYHRLRYRAGVCNVWLSVGALVLEMVSPPTAIAALQMPKEVVARAHAILAVHLLKIWGRARLCFCDWDEALKVCVSGKERVGPCGAELPGLV